nr:polyprenyl synthetase family protein [Flavobacteriales bacterium]
NEDSKAVARVIERVVDAGGIAHAQRKMLEYRDQALQLLHGFPETPARHSLEGLVHLTVERTK